MRPVHLVSTNQAKRRRVSHRHPIGNSTIMPPIAIGGRDAQRTRIATARERFDGVQPRCNGT